MLKIGGLFGPVLHLYHMKTELLTGCISLCIAAGYACAAPLAYQFQIDEPSSGISATVTNRIVTSGTLIGDYNADTNPNGTRTKPGLFGSFGATENLAVNVAVTGQLSGSTSSRTSGSFGMIFDAEAGTASINGLVADYLASGRLRLPATVALNYESFRTRNPSSTYPGGIPVTLPFGEAEISALTVTQVGPGSLGTLALVSGNVYEFTVAPIVSLMASFDFFGNTFDIPGSPAALVISGTVTLNADGTAALTSVQPINFENGQDVNQPLPQQAFALPTVLPPGSTANVLMDLTLSRIESSLSGTSTLNANGMLIPAPGVVAISFAGLTVLRRRR